MILRERQALGIAIYRRRGAEYDVPHLESRHRIEQRKSAAQVVVVVLQGPGDRLARGFVSGEVDDSLHRSALEYFAKRAAVTNVRLVKLDFSPAQGAYAFKGGQFAVCEA